LTKYRRRAAFSRRAVFAFFIISPACGKPFQKLMKISFGQAVSFSLMLFNED